MVIVEYQGFLQRVRRTFSTRLAAEQWARQVGKFFQAVITEEQEYQPAPRVRKYYVFHCNNRWNGNYRVIVCGANQSEAAGKLRCPERVGRELVCVSECATRQEAERIAPRIR